MLKEKTTIKKIGENSVFIRVPAKIRSDSQFPFTEDEELTIEIQDQQLIIQKSGEQNEI